MEHPALRLTVEKGPRKGETLECKPGTVARVGRFVRGNTLAIRDPGVSQKHLAFEFLPDGPRWAVSDLGTSNGTLVNDRQIPPSAPFPLSDGDIIKIGESTVIAIEIVAEERHGLDGGIDDADEKERSGVGGRRGRPRRGAPPLPAVEESVAGAAEGRIGGRGKGRPKKGASSAAAPAVPKEDEILERPEVEESVRYEAKNVAAAKGRVRGRRPITRSAAAKVPKDQKQTEEPHVSVRVDDSEAVEPVEVFEKGSKMVVPDAAEEAVDGGEKEEPARDEEKEEVEDMEKMTLGEWFDRMEKFLPLMINDVAEEIIASLRAKAQHFDEFMSTSSTSH
ncbi:FHA [Musa troglodytarum]|uniref:FHA n=1 Tax=Musa troglodytarum TaxID=320322 RepID=A0A9E7EQ78_9LILI|nr:FHA [Musa troglodytarum]